MRRDPSSIRSLFESNGLLIREWDKVRTDWLTIGAMPPREEADLVAAAREHSHV